VNEERELYSPAAERYRDFRPRYPESAIQQAVQSGRLSSGATVLEIGCGPGTATLPFASLHFEMHCIDPSTGMLEVAMQECSTFSNVSFEQVLFEDFEHRGRFDAILAASSLHWTISQDSISKLHRLVVPGGALILLWNLPWEPPFSYRNEVAEANRFETPYYFGGHSHRQHHENLSKTVLKPIEKSKRFSSFSEHTYPLERKFSVDEYLNFVQTLSPIIRLPADERERFLSSNKEAMSRQGDSFLARGECILNVAHSIPSKR